VIVTNESGILGTIPAFGKLAVWYFNPSVVVVKQSDPTSPLTLAAIGP
jgi:hypothetical protein